MERDHATYRQRTRERPPGCIQLQLLRLFLSMQLTPFKQRQMVLRSHARRISTSVHTRRHFPLWSGLDR
jgi:hypothetical protein